MKNSKERRLARQAAKAAEIAAQLAGETTNEAPAATLEEANAALSETSKVINMKQAKEKSDKKKAKLVVGKKKVKDGGMSVKSLPALPKKAGTRKPRPEVDCECGCGGKTKSRFVPGHDSYLRGLVIRVDREVMTLADVEKLGGKGQRTAVERELGEMKKKAKAEKKGAKKAAEVETIAEQA